GEEEVERVLQRLREQAGAWRPQESGTPEEGDRVSVTVVRLEEDGEESAPRDYELVLGEGDAIPDVERAIATLEPGGSGDFPVRLPAKEGEEEGGPGE